MLLCHVCPRSFGTTLWYPTYIKNLNTAAHKAEKEDNCNRVVGGVTMDTSSLPYLCGCSYTSASIEDTIIGPVHLTNSSFKQSVFANVTFQGTVLSNVAFDNCSMVSTTFSNVTMENVVFNATVVMGTVYSGKWPLNASDGCHSENRRYINTTTFDSTLHLWSIAVLNESPSYAQGNSCVSSISTQGCAATSDEYKVYREAFLFAASSIPGTIVTAIVVDLRCMWRSLWIGEHACVWGWGCACGGECV